jgi:transcriptional regulator with GAF, ATPase, and Fis domain
MPPLRDRADDIPLLTMFFLEKSARKLGRPIKQVSEETMHLLCGYAWPGNIRELQNVIERAIVLATGPVLHVDERQLPQSSPEPLARAPEGPVSDTPPAAPSPPVAGDGAPLEDVERQHIVAVLERAKWRIEGNGGAAKILNLEPSTLRSRMKKLGIKRAK